MKSYSLAILGTVYKDGDRNCWVADNGEVSFGDTDILESGAQLYAEHVVLKDYVQNLRDEI